MYEGRGRNKKNGDFIVCIALLECSNIFDFCCVLIVVRDFLELIVSASSNGSGGSLHRCRLTTAFVVRINKVWL